MKKLIYLFLTVLIVGCSSDDSSNSDGCPGEIALIGQLENAGSLLEEEPTTENCQAYVDAITLFLDCSQNITTADRLELEAAIELIDCDLF